MKNGWIIPALAATLLMAAPAADAQKRRTKSPVRKRTTARRSGAESGLLGVRLFDTGIRVVQIYGNPESIQPITAGSGNSAGGGGRGGFGGGGGGGGTRSSGGAGAGGAPPPSAGPRVTGPTSGGKTSPPDPMDGMIGNFQRGDDDRGSGGGAPPAPSSPSGGAGGGGGGAGGGGGTTETAEYTRWIYTKNGAKFGFVLDKFNRVIQIEAIGLQNGRVRTARGISFGSTFSQVIKAYAPSSAPDGYDITGDTVTVKFLTRQHVAFRLSKLGTNPRQPHVVTGIVVAAGKA